MSYKMLEIILLYIILHIAKVSHKFTWEKKNVKLKTIGNGTFNLIFKLPHYSFRWYIFIFISIYKLSYYHIRTLIFKSVN